MDQQDFLILRSNYGKLYPSFREGNLNGDASIDFRDFQLLEQNFGRTLPQSAPAATAHLFSVTRIQLKRRPHR